MIYKKIYYLYYLFFIICYQIYNQFSKIYLNIITKLFIKNCAIFFKSFITTFQYIKKIFL